MTQLPALDVNAIGRMVDTLTLARLSKYLKVTGNNLQQALRLYALNSKISAALLSDLHDVDIAMRNKSTNAASTFC